MNADRRVPLLALIVCGLFHATPLDAQQSGRATGRVPGRPAPERPILPTDPWGSAFDLQRRSGSATGWGGAGFGYLPAWSWNAPNVRLLCRPLGPSSGLGPAAFLAECAPAPLGGGLGYAGWYPPPIVLPPEERPHRFYSRFNPDDAGSGVPPLTCDPRPGAPCPPAATAPGAAAPGYAGSYPRGYGGGAPGALPADCADVTAHTVAGAVYRGRVLISTLGVERAEDAALAIEAALARGATVALLGEHGYPLYLPPAAFLETIESRDCRR